MSFARRLGRSELEVSALSRGTNPIGGPSWQPEKYGEQALDHGPLSAAQMRQIDDILEQEVT